MRANKKNDLSIVRQNNSKKVQKVLGKKEKPVQKTAPAKKTKKFPNILPFWARLKISKHRTTLVIDEEPVVNKKTKKVEEGFVHREATHTPKKDREKILPNPDKSDDNAMYLKRPQKLPKRLFEPHNKKLDMPKNLIERYAKNNKQK